MPCWAICGWPTGVLRGKVRWERPSWGLALLMRPERFAPQRLSVFFRYDAARTMRHRSSRKSGPVEACLPPYRLQFESVDDVAALSRGDPTILPSTQPRHRAALDAGLRLSAKEPTKSLRGPHAAPLYSEKLSTPAGAIDSQWKLPMEDNLNHDLCGTPLPARHVTAEKDVIFRIF